MLELTCLFLEYDKESFCLPTRARRSRQLFERNSLVIVTTELIWGMCHLPIWRFTDSLQKARGRAERPVMNSSFQATVLQSHWRNMRTAGWKTPPPRWWWWVPPDRSTMLGLLCRDAVTGSSRSRVMTGSKMMGVRVIKGYEEEPAGMMVIKGTNTNWWRELTLEGKQDSGIS